MSRASAAGSQATYATARGARSEIARTTWRLAPTRGGSSTTTSAAPTPRCRTRSTRPATLRAQGYDARLARECREAALSPSTATTAPAGPTAWARKAANRPTPAYRSSTDSPGCTSTISSTHSTKVRGAFTCGCQNPSAATSSTPVPVEVSTCSTTTPSSGSRAAGCAIRQRSISTTSCERCLRRPRPPSGRWTYCIRLRQASPSDGGTSSTTTSRSRPASRCSCSETTAAFSRRCSSSVTCWKSQPPQSPGPAYGHGASTRSGEATCTSTASARRNRPSSSVTSAVTRSPGNACRTKTTCPSWRATKCPPCATGPISSSSRLVIGTLGLTAPGPYGRVEPPHDVRVLTGHVLLLQRVGHQVVQLRRLAVEVVDELPRPVLDARADAVVAAVEELLSVRRTEEAEDVDPWVGGPFELEPGQLRQGGQYVDLAGRSPHRAGRHTRTGEHRRHLHDLVVRHAGVEVETVLPEGLTVVADHEQVGVAPTAGALEHRHHVRHERVGVVHGAEVAVAGLVGDPGADPRLGDVV